MNPPVQFVCVRDQDGVVAIGRDDLVRYAGPGQIVASALCLRLFHRAFSDLSPDQPPHRDSIRVLTAFPGDGALDCIEMITRARTRQRLTIDLDAGPPETPPAPAGRFYFEIAIARRSMGYRLADGFFTDDFVAMVRRHQGGDGTAEELARYQMAKYALIGRLLGAPGRELFHTHPVAAPIGTGRAT